MCGGQDVANPPPQKRWPSCSHRFQLSQGESENASGINWSTRPCAESSDSPLPLSRDQVHPLGDRLIVATCSAAMLSLRSRNLQRRETDRSRPGDQCSGTIRFTKAHARDFSRKHPRQHRQTSGAAISPQKRFRLRLQSPSASAESGPRRPFCADPWSSGRSRNFLGDCGIAARASEQLVGRSFSKAFTGLPPALKTSDQLQQTPPASSSSRASPGLIAGADRVTVKQRQTWRMPRAWASEQFGLEGNCRAVAAGELQDGPPAMVKAAGGRGPGAHAHHRPACHSGDIDRHEQAFQTRRNPQVRRGPPPRGGIHYLPR